MISIICIKNGRSTCPFVLYLIVLSILQTTIIEQTESVKLAFYYAEARSVIAVIIVEVLVIEKTTISLRSIVSSTI